MPSNHLILCHPLLLLSSIFPNIRVFSSELTLCIRWPKYRYIDDISLGLVCMDRHNKIRQMEWLKQQKCRNVFSHTPALGSPRWEGLTYSGASLLQSFLAPGSFLVSQFFASGDQSIGVSALASVLPMKTQD